MPKINELDAHVADLIAAGEVVERPASVIKELMENSFDAGAGVITVEIKNGGMTYMRVTDDGCGIAAEDVKTAFLRHATSKIHDKTSLEAIGTLGFRGEALAAIASVSRIEFYTRERGSAEGTRLTLEAGEVTDIAPYGCPEGTTIVVCDLFYNTPARQKFMKTDRAEASAVSAVVLRAALSRPEVSVRYVKDGNEECHTPGDSRVDSCIYSLLGRDFSKGLIEAESDGETISVTGFISSPDSARGNRSYQFFFLNGRYIRSKTLQAALEQAYANVLTSGRYPSCVLYITAKLSDVDVNVHPAKTEVRFRSDKEVFDGVYYAVVGALERAHANPLTVQEEPRIPLSDAVQGAVRHGGTGRAGTGSEGGAGHGGAWRSVTSSGTGHGGHGGTVQDGTGFGGTLLPGDGAIKPTGAAAALYGGGFKSGSADEFRRTYSSGSFVTAVPGVTERDTAKPVRNEDREVYQTRFVREDDGFAGGFRIIGEAMETYIIAEKDGSLWMIDKHAAHERIRFDALRAGGGETMSQSLIAPVICRLGAENTELLLENTELLDTLGFSVENFGGDAAAVRCVPADLDPEDAESVLSEICTQLKRGGLAESARRDNILKAVACKTAVKAGDSSDIFELETLARRVFTGEVRYCPHGRPVAYEITKQSVERGFKRT